MRPKQLALVFVMWVAGLLGLMFVIPGIVHLQLNPQQEDSTLFMNPNLSLPLSESEAQPVIPVWLSHEQRIEMVALEDYVRGVVAAEMPMDFELEALKAQAIAARTYVIRRLIKGDYSDMGVGNAVVTDTVQHQAYINELPMNQIEKLNRAVEETAGLIATYNGEPIEALYFSTSNGYTENAEDYFTTAIPYLRSVPSPWDEQSPKYRNYTQLNVSEVMEKLELPQTEDVQKVLESITVHAWTTGKSIHELEIAGRRYSGREIREALELPSTTFTWEVANGQVMITSIGYGHGVGMSQYGANGMALEGKTAEEILLYYYQGVRIEKMQEEHFPASAVALAHDRK